MTISIVVRDLRQIQDCEANLQLPQLPSYHLKGPSSRTNSTGVTWEKLRAGHEVGNPIHAENQDLKQWGFGFGE